MKRVLLICICLLLAVFCTACGSSGTVVTSINNADFEAGTTSSGGISDWQRYDYSGKLEVGNPYTEFTLVEGQDGGNALCIYNMQLNDARVYQHLDAEPGAYYKVTVDIKTEDIPEEGAGANISLIDYAGTSAKTFGTHDWETKTLYVTVDDDNKKGFDIALSLGGYSAESSGKAYFDNLTIEQVDQVPASAEALRAWNLDTETSGSDSESTTNITWLDNIFRVLFFAVVGGLLVYLIYYSMHIDDSKIKRMVRRIKPKKNSKATVIQVGEPLTMSEKLGRPKKKDLIIMLVMVVITAMFSFYNLGDTKAASNYWKPNANDEYIILEFDEPTKIDRISYYANVPTSGQYDFYYIDEETGGEILSSTITEESCTFFEWKYLDTSFTASRVKIVASKAGLPINEVAFYTIEDSEYILANVTVVEDTSTERASSGTASNLVDEQDCAHPYSTYMDSTYFDEIYHARTAYEQIHGMSIYEVTHPPLGKIIISVGIMIFGMNPFGWRFAGTLFGIALVPLMYLFALRIFRKRSLAFTASFLMMFDFMRTSQTRIATIDTYSIVFVILMYYFMYEYFVTKSYEKTLWGTLRPLICCGLSFGVGVASKWTSLYAGAGLCMLFILANVREYMETSTENRKAAIGAKGSWPVNRLLPVIAVCIVMFICVPLAIYIL